MGKQKDNVQRPSTGIFSITNISRGMFTGPRSHDLVVMLAHTYIMVILCTKTLNLRKGQRTKQTNRILVDLISKIWDTKN